MSIPAYLPYFVFAGTAATILAILYGLNRALTDAAWPIAQHARAVRVSAVVLLGWLALSIALAARASTMSKVTPSLRSNSVSCRRS